MSEEIFDVVDERDEIIDQKTRREVHEHGLLHRAIHVFLFHEEKLFLQRRSFQKDTAPGCWDSSCSGHVDAGEVYAVSMRRELEEELGIRENIPVWPVFKLPPSAATGWEFVWVYRGFAAGPFTLHPEEIMEGDWFTPSEIDQLIQTHPGQVASSFQKIWENAKKTSCFTGI